MTLRHMEAETRGRAKGNGRPSSTPLKDHGVGAIKSVDKAMGILRELSAASRPMRISELAKSLQLTPSVVSRLVATLARGGLVDHDEETNRIQLGLSLALLGHGALGRRKLDYLAIPVMARLSEEFKEYISLSRLVEGRVVMVRGGPVEVMQQDTFLTAVVPIHASAPGKLLAAWISEPDLLKLLEARGMDAYTPKTITSMRHFKEELAKIRREQFALDDEELVPSLRHVAAPIFDHDGKVVAALSAGGPTKKLNSEEVLRLRTALTNAGIQISRQLGYSAAALKP
ncbi:MAG: IclR family transcriptional regulator [Proteobacteria bacterium]|nr:IclR family transcriptional regulator [Pseudomonadota bacterium]